MLVGAGGNTTLQVGKDGVLLVDTQFAPLAPKIMAAVRTLSQMPVRYIINTHVHGDHTGGNGAIAKLGGEGAIPRIIANDHVLNRMTAPPAPRASRRAGKRLAERRIFHADKRFLL